MFKLLICGHKGFIGSYLFKTLKNKFDIYGADVKSEDRTNEFKVDFRNIDNIKEVINSVRPNYLINVIGLNKNNELNKFIEINVQPISNILQTVVDLNIKINKIIHTSSSAVYGIGNTLVNEESSTEPVNYYGLSKLLSEKICLYFKNNYNLNVIIVRPSNVVGIGLSDDFVIPKLIRQLITAKNLNEKHLDLGNLNISRDFIDINTATNFYEKLLNDEINDYGVVNISSGLSFSLKEVVRIICNNIEYYPELINNNGNSEKLMNLICLNSIIKEFNINQNYQFEHAIINLIQELINNK